MSKPKTPRDRQPALASVPVPKGPTPKEWAALLERVARMEAALRNQGMLQ